MSTITGTRIDQVLHDAVETGAVPNVVAMAADHHGPIYEGAAGPRVAGGSDTVTADTTFRIASMTKMVATTAALQLVEEGKLDLDDAGREVPPGVREAAGARGLRRRHAEAARAQDQGHRAPAGQPHVRPRVLVLERGHRALGGGDGHAERALRRRGDLHRPAGRRPGHDLRVRDQHGLARPGRGGGERHAAGRLHRRAHPQAARAWSTRRSRSATSSAPTWCRSTCAARTARGRRPRSTGRATRTGGPAATACTRPRATTCASSRCCSTAGRSTACRSSSTGPSTPRSRNQIGDLDFPERSRPPTRARAPTSWPARATSSASGCCSTTTTCRGCARVGSGAWAGLFNTHFWVDRRTGVTGAIYSQTLPFVEPPVFQVYADFEKALYASL